jgi:hypothetical protein
MILVISPTLVLAQTLTLVPANSNPGTSVSMNLALVGGGAPAALQWNLSYPTAAVTSITVSTGAAATAAGKTVMCAPAGTGTYACVLAGLNQNGIADGTVATANITLASGVTGAVPFGVGSALGATPLGAAQAVTATGSTIHVGGTPPPPPAPPATPVLSGFSCALPSNGQFNPGDTATCTVAFSAAATTATDVALTSDHQHIVQVPSTVTIARGSTTASFTATAGHGGTAHLTAAYAGVTLDVTLVVSGG